MTPEQTAAYIQAQTALFLAELEMMKADNLERLNHGYALAYGPEQWKELMDRWDCVIGHNAIMQLYQNASLWNNPYTTHIQP